MFEIRLGVPEIENLWSTLSSKIESNTFSKNEAKLYKKLVKVFKLLQNNPYHNSLRTHEIDVLSKRYGMKVWESYLENHKPAAGRIFWIYYPSLL